MLINQDFTVDRAKYIGGSDIGAILGLSKYRSPLEVWLEKTGKKINQPDSLPMRFGSFAEEFVANEYARQTGFALAHYKEPIIHPAYSFMVGHIDRFVLAGTQTCATLFNDDGSCAASALLECKTASPFNQSDWGESGTDQVPMSYLVQCLWYLAITQLNQCDLAVLFGSSDFRIYQIERDVELEALLINQAYHFWTEYVQADKPPPAQNSSDYQTLFKKEVSGKSIEANLQTSNLIGRLHILNQEIEIKEGEVLQIKQHIMGQMGDAEKLTYQNQVLATWKQPKSSFRLDTKRLEKDHPDLATQYQVEIQATRRLVIKDYQSNPVLTQK